MYSAVHEDMATPTAVRIDLTPTYNDLAIADLVHRALAAIQGAGRWGDRKVFIVALWTTMLAIEAATSGTLTEGCTIAHFQAWLLRARLLTRDGTQDGARLVVLCRADLVAAMDPALVAASETLTDGAAFHFVLDPRVATEYAPRNARVPTVGAGRVGKVGASPRTA